MPKIIRAIRFVPVGSQAEMKPVELGSGSIDPYRDDFFRKVIEERKKRDEADPLHYFLKILANAGCYGIYAEVNRQRTGRTTLRPSTSFRGTSAERCETKRMSNQAHGTSHLPP